MTESVPDNRPEPVDLTAEMVAILPRLRRFCFALTGTMHEGDDVAQACFEKALRSQGQWQPGTRLDSWMFRIAQNLWIDMLRTRKRHGTEVDPVVLDFESHQDGRRDVEARDLVKKTRAAMLTLPEEQRVLVASVLVDGQTYKEASLAYGIPIGTVMSRLARARRALELAVFGEGGASKETYP